jgi:hypothetical protein
VCHQVAQRARTGRQVIVLHLALSLSTAGCQPNTPPVPDSGSRPDAASQAYADGYKDVLLAYRDQMKRVTSHPRPNSTQAGERRARLAKQMEDLAQAYERCLQRFDRLRPPPALREVHDSTREFLSVSATGYRKWATATRAGDREQAAAVVQESEASERAALTRMRQAAEQHGQSLPNLDKSIEAYLRSARD